MVLSGSAGRAESGSVVSQMQGRMVGSSRTPLGPRYVAPPGAAVPSRDVISFGKRVGREHGNRPALVRSVVAMSLLAAVDAAGLAAPLVVTEGSRVEEVDVYFRQFLARNFRIGDRLDAGFYSITVAP